MSAAARDALFEPPPERLRPVLGGRHLADAAVTLFLTRLAGILLAWLLEIILVRALTPASWQVMSRFLTLTTLFSIAQLGLPESVLYFAARSRTGGPALALTARTSALLAGIGTLLAIPFHVFPELTLRLLGSYGPRVVGPLSLFVVSDLAFTPLPSLLLAEQQPKLASALSFGTRVLIALFVLVALLCGLELEGALYSIAFGSGVCLLIGWLVVLEVTRSPGTAGPPRVGLGEQLTVSMPVGLTRFVQIGNAKLDKYIVMAVFQESVYGSYYLGAAELPIPAMICTAVMSVMMADLVALAEARDHTRLLALWHQSIEKVALVSLPLFGLAMIFAEPIFVAFYGEAHAQAAAQFRIFQILLLARVTNFSNVSLALGQPGVPLVAAAIALSLNAGLSFIAVRSVGLSGPALANVTSIAISTVYTLWAIKKSLGVSWSRLFPFRSYLRTLAAAVLAAAAAAPIVNLGLPAWLTLLGGGTLYVAVYYCLAHASGLIKVEDRAFLWSVLNLRFLRPAPACGSTE